MQQHSTGMLETGASTRVVAYWGILLSGLMIPSSLDSLDWTGTPELQAWLDGAAAALALLVAGLALRYFRANGRPMWLLVAMAFFGAGILDAFNIAVYANAFGADGAAPQSWLASRLYLGTVLLWACFSQHREPGRRRDNLIRIAVPLLFIALFFVALTLLPRPNSYSPGSYVHRPQELGPALLFLLALISALRGGRWRQDTATHWLVLSLIVGLVCQILIMPLSSMPFDAEFHTAQTVRALTYTMMLAGLLRAGSAPQAAATRATPAATGHRIWLGIGTKTAILCGVVAVLAVIPTAIQSGRTLHRLVLDTAMLELTGESTAAGRHLERLYAGTERDLWILAGAAPVAGLFRARQNGGFDAQRGGTAAHWQASLVGMLQNWGAAHPELRYLGYVDAESRAIIAEYRADTAPRPDPLGASVRNLPDGITWQPIVALPADDDTERTLVADATLPTRAPDGRHVGVFVLRLDVTAALAPATDIDASWYVADDTGAFLVRSTDDAADTTGRAHRLSDRFPDLAGQFMSPGDGGAVLTGVGADQVALGVYRTAATRGRRPLLMISAKMRERIELPAAELGRQRRLEGQITLMLAILIGWFVARRLARPVQELAQAAETFGQTGRRPEFSVTTNDEVGHLAIALGRMMGDVERRSQQLEEQAEQRRRDLHTIAAAEARYRAVIDNMPDAQIVCDSNGKILSFNPAAEEIFGYAKDEAIGQSASILLPEPLKSRLAGHVSHYLRTGQRNITGQKREAEPEAVRKDGSLFPVALRFETFDIDREKFFSVMIRDITDAKQIRERLQRLATAVESAAEGIVILDAETRVEYVNPAFLRYTQYTIEELQGRLASDISAPEADPEQIAALHRSMAAGKNWSGVLSIRRRDGQLHSEDTTVSPIRNPESGRITNYVSVIRDVTERVRMEQQLRQAQKLESIGQLAAGIAHEINTPTQYVSDNTVFLQRAFGGLMDAVTAGNALLENARTGHVDDDAITAAEAAFKKARLDFLQRQIPPAFEQSLEGLEQVSRIVSAMKEFSHPAQDKTGLDLNRAIQSTITVASSEWKYVAEMHTGFDESLPLVPCLPGAFNQVILNIIVNAAHAIGDVVGDGADGRGQITVTTRHAGDCAEIRIADTGAGMSEDVRARIFDTFFTTKEVGRGTGQGLAIAYNVIVEKHGGTIDVESNPGAGTTFIVRLPLQAPTDDSDTGADAGERAA